MKHQWTTGRIYDAWGQRMVAKVDGQQLLFSDLSRNINGAVPLGSYLMGRTLDRYAIESLVMTNYDHGNFSRSDETLTWEYKQ